MAIVDTKHKDSEATQTPVEPVLPPAYTEPGSDVKHHSMAHSVGDPALQSKLDALERKLTRYAEAPRSRSRSRELEEAEILSYMRDLSTSHPDLAAQKYWARRADAFENASDEKDKMRIVKDVVKAFAVILAAPLAIAGMVLIGTGHLLKASGDLISGGTVRSRRCKRRGVESVASPSL